MGGHVIPLFDGCYRSGAELRLHSQSLTGQALLLADLLQLVQLFILLVSLVLFTRDTLRMQESSADLKTSKSELSRCIKNEDTRFPSR